MTVIRTPAHFLLMAPAVVLSSWYVLVYKLGLFIVGALHF